MIQLGTCGVCAHGRSVWRGRRLAGTGPAPPGTPRPETRVRAPCGSARAARVPRRCRLGGPARPTRPAGPRRHTSFSPDRSAAQSWLLCSPGQSVRYGMVGEIERAQLFSHMFAASFSQRKDRSPAAVDQIRMVLSPLAADRRAGERSGLRPGRRWWRYCPADLTGARTSRWVAFRTVNRRRGCRVRAAGRC